MEKSPTIEIELSEWLKAYDKLAYTKGFLIGLQAGVANMHPDAIYDRIGELIQTLSKGENK